MFKKYRQLINHHQVNHKIQFKKEINIDNTHERHNKYK